MNANHRAPADDHRAAQLTAYALGGLDSAERATVEGEVAASDEARDEVRIARVLASHVARAVSQDHSLAPSVALRDAIEERLLQPGAPRPDLAPAATAGRIFARRPFATAVALAACLLVALIPWAILSRSTGVSLDRSPLAIDNAAPEATSDHPSSNASASPDDLRPLERFTASAAASPELPADSAASRSPSAAALAKGPSSKTSVGAAGASASSLPPAAPGTAGPDKPSPAPSPASSGIAAASTPIRSSADAPSSAAPVAASAAHAPAVVSQPSPRTARRVPLIDLTQSPLRYQNLSAKKAGSEPVRSDPAGFWGFGNYGPALPGRMPLAKKSTADSEKRMMSIQTRASIADPSAGNPLPLPGEKSFAESSGASNALPYSSLRNDPFLSVALRPLSTFAVDVGTASYAEVGRCLREGVWPPADAVRVEELVNYFPYHYAPPKLNDPFSIEFETAQCPWNPDHRLLRIGLQAREMFPERDEPGRQVSGSRASVVKSVKLRIEFNPAEVARYRLLGCESDLAASPDSHDVTQHADELLAGQVVTVLYEIVPSRASLVAALDDPPLKFPRPKKEPTEGARGSELLALSLRYQLPQEQEIRWQEYAVRDSGKRFGEASPDFRFAAAVASFGIALRNSANFGTLSLKSVEEIAAAALGEDPGGRRAEFLDLVRRAEQLRAP